MRILEWIKIFGKSNIKKKESRTYTITLNDSLLEKAVVHSTLSHSKTYKLLREYKTPQYDTLYVLRNKKGFNTMGFTLNYDVVICDKNGKVLELLQDTIEGYISKYYNKSHFIYFMTVGSINHYKIELYNILRLQGIWT